MCSMRLQPDLAQQAVLGQAGVVEVPARRLGRAVDEWLRRVHAVHVCESAAGLVVRRGKRNKRFAWRRRWI